MTSAKVSGYHYLVMFISSNQYNNNNNNNLFDNIFRQFNEGQGFSHKDIMLGLLSLAVLVQAWVVLSTPLNTNSHINEGRHEYNKNSWSCTISQFTVLIFITSGNFKTMTCTTRVLLLELLDM